MEFLPPVISEQQVALFKYWHSGKLHDGMRYQSGLFRRVEVFGTRHRDRAYALGCALCQQGHETVITCNSSSYVVWVSLSVPQYYAESQAAEQAYSTTNAF